MIERFGLLVLAAPRATLVITLLLVQVAVTLVVLAVLVPAIFMQSREPFERLMEFVELVSGRSRERDGSRPSALAPLEPPIDT